MKILAVDFKNSNEIILIEGDWLKVSEVYGASEKCLLKNLLSNSLKCTFNEGKNI